MNFRNLAENLIIVIVSASVGGFIGYTASTKANQQVVSQLTPTIERAIDKETIKNEIKNEIQIDKIKKSDSIRIVMDPHNRQDPTNIIVRDTCNGVDLSKLSESQLRRLRRWLE